VQALSPTGWDSQDGFRQHRQSTMPIEDIDGDTLSKGQEGYGKGAVWSWCDGGVHLHPVAWLYTQSPPPYLSNGDLRGTDGHPCRYGKKSNKKGFVLEGAQVPSGGEANVLLRARGYPAPGELGAWLLESEC
jgi:hypothetical protein